MSNSVIRKTQKRKVEVKLPSKSDMVFIPNRITNAKYSYTLLQEKILNYVLFNLQEAIKINMNGGDYKQLELFREINADRVGLSIPINTITTPNHYSEVREAAENLGKSLIRITQTNPNTGKKEMRSLYLFGAVVTPLDKIKKPEIKIELSKEVARLLVEMDMNKMGKPSNYTSFQLQIVSSAKNKYTPRIYKLISSWKEKGGFYMGIEEFRDWLELGEKYKTFSELKRNILIPVQKELEGKAFCWFNCKEKSFEDRKGKTVVGINWKVITPELEQVKEIQIEGIKNLLRIHMALKDGDMRQLEPIFSSQINFSKVNLRIVEISQYIKTNADKIDNPKAYIIQSLLKQFGKK